MNIKQFVASQLEQAKALGERLREISREVQDAASLVRSEGVSELSRMRRTLEPKLRSTVSAGMQKVQKLFDELNQTLAEQAIPPFRKAGVSQKRLQEASPTEQQIPAKNTSTVVASVAAAKPAASATLKSGQKPKITKSIQGKRQPVSTGKKTETAVVESKPASSRKTRKTSAVKTVQAKAKTKRGTGRPAARQVGTKLADTIGE